MAQVSTCGTRRVRLNHVLITIAIVVIASTAFAASLNTNDHGKKATPPDSAAPGTRSPQAITDPTPTPETIPTNTIAAVRYHRATPTPVVPPVVVEVLPPPPTTSPSTSPSTSEPSAQHDRNVAAIVSEMHVRVLPGTAQFMTDPTPGVTSEGMTRIFSGKVLYAVGDNQMWQLVAFVSGADGYRTTSTCGSLNQFLAGDGPRVTPGPSVIVGAEPVVICQGIVGHSGGAFSASLDIDSPGVRGVTVRLEVIH